MGNIRKIGEEYYIEFHARGLLYQQKIGKDAVAAERVLKEVEEKIAKGELMTIVREIHLESFFSDYCAQIKGLCSPSTFRRLESTVHHFQGFLKTHRPEISNLSQVTPAIVEQYRSSLLKNLSKSGVIFSYQSHPLRDLLYNGLFLYYDPRENGYPHKNNSKISVK